MGWAAFFGVGTVVFIGMAATDPELGVLAGILAFLSSALCAFFLWLRWPVPGEKKRQELQQKAQFYNKCVAYTYGNGLNAASYQHDLIEGSVDFSKVLSTVRYVVKCFGHMGIYAAWAQEVCRGTGKCRAYKKDLATMEATPNCSHAETTLEGDITMCWFRGEEGVQWFIQEKLLNV